MIIYQGQILKKLNCPGKPKLITVLTKDCENEWFIRVEKENGETTIMTKGAIYKFYEPIENGRQTELFGRPKTYIDNLKEKHLIDS